MPILGLIMAKKQAREDEVPEATIPAVKGKKTMGRADSKSKAKPSAKLPTKKTRAG